MPLTHSERVEKLKQARELLGQAAAGVELPQIESLLREADMTLHWALWNLGEIDDLRPELEAMRSLRATE